MLAVRTPLVAVVVLCTVCACGGGGSSSPTEPPMTGTAPDAICVDALDGVWQVSWSSACGEQGQTTVTIAAAAGSCDFSFEVDGIGTVSGQATGSTPFPVEVTLPDSCAADTVPGEIRVLEANDLTMPFGSGEGCCRHGWLDLER